MNHQENIRVAIDTGAASAGPACIQPVGDGRLLLVFTASDGRASRLAGRWSRDEGQSWDQPFPVVTPQDSVQVGMPSLVRLPSARLLLIFKQQDSDSAADGQAMTRFSDDAGSHWSDPSPITPAGTSWRFLNDSLVRLETGRLLLPVAHTDLGCLTWVSDDDGLSWQMGGGAIKPKEGETVREPTIAELPNGRVAMFLRTSNPANQIYISSSADGAVGWRFDNEWGPVSLDAPCLARRLPGSDEVLLVWNNHCLATNLTSAISRGPLRFWEHFQVLEEQDRWPDPTTYSSPSLAFVGSNAHLTYVETVAGGAPRLIYRRLPIAWFRTDAPARPMIYDARGYIKEMWEQAPADDPHHYIREFATATFNPADVRRPQLPKSL